MIPSSASEGLESTDSVDQNITSIIDQFNQLQERYNEVQGPTIHHVAVMDSLSEVDVPGLHEDQQCAYDIVTQHICVTLQGKQQDQLLIILTGEGGTGKSCVIQAIAQFSGKKTVQGKCLQWEHIQVLLQV